VKVPLAVLVNQLSASASEIVAGAVKNLDRGVVIGETTFGKGSVQMLFDIPSPVSTSTKGDDDRLGLKLTTAQYLTPGDLSIQGVGVTPDVDLVRLRVQKTTDESIIQLQRSKPPPAGIPTNEWHLDHPQRSEGHQALRDPVLPVRTLRRAGEARAGRGQGGRGRRGRPGSEQEEEEEDLEALEENIVDFPMEFARDLLANTKAARRREMLQGRRASWTRSGPRRTRSCPRPWRSWASTGPRDRPTRPPARCRSPCPRPPPTTRWSPGRP
jgi:carboxyl-terminal processing protease